MSPDISSRTIDGPPETYEYRFTKRPLNKFDNEEDGTLSRKTWPDGRFLALEHYQFGSNSVLGDNDHNFSDNNDLRIGRVRKLLAPAGPGNASVPIYTFFYDLCTETNYNERSGKTIKHGATFVDDAHRRKSIYEFNASQRLTGIKRFLDNGSTYTHEIYHWAPNGTPDCTNLLSRKLLGPDGRTVFARTYKYDANGNAIEDSFYGNLTGLSDREPHLDGVTEKNGAECYRKFFKYSQDGFNVPLEEDDGITKINYVYAPNSNKLIAKYQGDKTKWYRRWFYKYDHNGAIVEEIQDDGTATSSEDLKGITQRKITKTEQNTSYPLAYPIKVEGSILTLLQVKCT